MGPSDAPARCANLSARFGARRMAGNDIGIGPIVVADCAPNVVSEIAEAIVSVCEKN